jgi:hypothetical protein
MINEIVHTEHCSKCGDTFQATTFVENARCPKCKLPDLLDIVDVSQHHDANGKLYLPSQPFGLYVWFRDLPIPGPNVSTSFRTRAEATAFGRKACERPNTTACTFRRATGVVITRTDS